jgi:hypothetical protein
MIGTTAFQTQPEAPKRDLAQARDMSQDPKACCGGADPDCECDDCDCPICFPGCC